MLFIIDSLVGLCKCEYRFIGTGRRPALCETTLIELPLTIAAYAAYATGSALFSLLSCSDLLPFRLNNAWLDEDVR